MRSLIGLQFILFSFLSYGESIPLPRGGKLQFESKNWNVVETKSIMGGPMLLITHKQEKDLKGFVLDGTIKTSPKCSSSKNLKWSYCEESQTGSHQIFLERKLSDNSFQSYVVSFNYPEKKSSGVHRLIEGFAKGLVGP